MWISDLEDAGHAGKLQPDWYLGTEKPIPPEAIPHSLVVDLGVEAVPKLEHTSLALSINHSKTIPNPRQKQTITMVLVCFWRGFGMVLQWFCCGFGMVLWGRGYQNHSKTKQKPY